MPEQNPDIQALYNSLCDQQDALSAEIQQTTDPKLAGAISTEIQEIAHRIILTQNLLFLADSPKLQDPVDNVKSASDKLSTAIDNIKDVTDVINAVSTYLADVDQAIDLAKTLGAAAWLSPTQWRNNPSKSDGIRDVIFANRRVSDLLVVCAARDSSISVRHCSKTI